MLCVLSALCDVVRGRGLLLAAALAGVGAIQPFASIRTVDITLTEGTSMAAALSPDRQWIAFDLVGGLWVMPARGGEAKRITPPYLEARQPAWSPDSDTIAFQGYDDGTWHIYAIGREGGEARALTSGEFDDREPAWAHEGSRIAFSSDRFGGIYTVWIVDAATRQVTQLSKRDAWMPTWSPNDEEITVISSDRFRGDAQPVPDRERQPGLWALRTDGRDRLIAPNAENVVAVAAGWSTDGRQLAVTTADGRLALNGAIVAGNEDVFPFRPQWVSGSEFLYTADGHIRRRSPVRTVDIPFTARVSLQRATYTIAHRDLESTARRPVKGIVTPVVSPDGGTIAFVALGDLWVMPHNRRPTRITDDAAVELDPAWSPDGSQLAFSSDRGGRMELWIYAFASNSARRITDERGAVTGAAWSPDGSHIAYLVDGRGFMATRVRPGNGLGGGLVSHGGEIGRPTWAPDSRGVAFTTLFRYSDRFREGLNQLVFHSFETSRETMSVLLPGHSAGNRENNGPVWSRDGSRMLFVSEGRLWSVDVDARGAPVAAATSVADDSPESPSWSQDSRTFVYQTPTGLRRMSPVGGTDTVEVPLEWTSGRPPARVVVHAGALFDGVVEALRGESDIVIENGVIADISGHRDELHAGAVVDAGGEVAIPGLVESHAHLDAGYGDAFGRLWLAYGITTLRIPAVNPYAGLELREAIESGRRVGPRVFIAGDPFDGSRVYYPGGVSVTSDDQLERELDRASTLGVDFFKTYVRLPDRYQKRVVDYAHGLGRPVTSHELFPAVAMGVDGVEHLRGTSRRGYSTKASSTNRAYKDVVETLSKSGMTLTPTIGIQGAFEARVTGDKTLLFDRRLALYPLRVVSRLTELALATPNPALDARIKAYEETLKAVVAGGGRVIAGTDAPIDPYGLSLHVELEAYVHAGLTPFQALQTATINAAQALGLEDQLGTIEVGKTADLTLLGGNPLDDIRNTRDVKRVIKGGRVYTLNDLITQR